METHNMVISQEDAMLIDQCLVRFIEDTGVRLALVIGRDGHLVGMSGSTEDVSIDSLSALAVGAFASSEALARLSGEQTFNSIFHQGVVSNVFISLVGAEFLLLCLFDYNASAPLVRLQAKVSAEALINIIERASTRSRQSHSDV